MNLNLIAPINFLGYGVAGLNSFLELNKKYEVSLFPIGRVEADPKFAPQIQEGMNRSQKFDWNAPCIRMFHQFSMAQFTGKEKIGWPIFELDTFNEIELHHLGYCDQWIVCSEWAKKVLVDNLYNHYKWPDIESNTHVVPLGIDNDFKPQESHMPNTIFLNVGKWEKRKGHDLIPKLFDSAFTEEDNVELWMLCENPLLKPDEQENWINRYKSMKLSSKVRIFPRQQMRDGVYNIMGQSHCGLFPARAEGWNLDMLEMMAMGKHIITTDYSAHTEYCNEENSFLVKPDKLEKAEDGKWFNGQGNWANLDNKTDELVGHMRTVHKIVQEGNRVNQAGINTGEQYQWSKSISRVDKVLEKL